MPNVHQLPIKWRFPLSPGSAARPYRLWNANEKKPLRWRCYSDLRRALTRGALTEAAFAMPGVSIEVYDARTGRLEGQFTKRVNSVDIFIPASSSAMKGAKHA